MYNYIYSILGQVHDHIETKISWSLKLILLLNPINIWFWLGSHTLIWQSRNCITVHYNYVFLQHRAPYVPLFHSEQ